jgi:hypothetical protein
MSMTYAIMMRPETALGITTYWLVVDGDNVGTIAPLLTELGPASIADHWVWRIDFPMMGMPDWCKGHSSSLEQARVEAEHAFTQVRHSLSQADYDEALWKKDGKARGLN